VFDKGLITTTNPFLEYGKCRSGGQAHEYKRKALEKGAGGNIGQQSLAQGQGFMEE